MSAGRRGLFLSVAFLGLALWLCPTPRAQAQPIRVDPVRPNDPQAGRHRIWQSELSPEQIRELLARFGQDDGKGDPFEDLIRQLVRDKNPNADPKQVDAAVKRFMEDKEFRDRVTDMAQKYKNQMGNGGANPKDMPKLKPEDIAKLVKVAPQNGKNGDPFKLPNDASQQNDPNNRFPPFDPRNPNFDPKKFPAVDPEKPPKFDPETKFPLDPETGRPVHPVTGEPIDPKNPPKFEQPVPPKVEPKNPRPNPLEPPKIDPKTGQPVEGPNNPDGKRKFDPDNPLGLPPESPEKVAKTKAAEAATALWEKNVGPIDESPAVKRAILELVSDNDAMDFLTDANGNNLFDMLQNDGGDNKFDLFGGGDGGGWELPKLDLGWLRNRDTNLDLPNRPPRERPSLPDSRPRLGTSAFDGLGSFNFGGMQVPWILMLILLALVVAAVLWWKWETIFKPGEAVSIAGGPGQWPIDPRAINTREDVVKAFEYLSVLICGPDAKTWTHSTIADELTALAATHGETAVKLARLYELARYAPLDEPLTRAELLEARRLVCDLAGMDE